MHFNFFKLARFSLIELILVKMWKPIEGFIVQMLQKVDPNSLVSRSRQDREVGRFSLRFNWGHEFKKHIWYLYLA